jgi:allophanate hydrolase subunit 1
MARLSAYGAHAVLAEYDSIGEVVAAAVAVRTAGLDEVEDVVPGARTVLVRHRGALRDGLRALLLAPPPAPPPAAASVVHIDVSYDGDDLDEVAATVGVSVAEVVRRHTAPTYVAAFCGFAPGFAYLVGLDPLLQLPRRATPRTRVPAGSVAVAAEFTAVYPTASPGGWHLLGRTSTVMFDVDRRPPAVVEPGTRVRFSAVVR